MQLTPEEERKKLEAEWKRASGIGNSRARWQAIRLWGGIVLMGIVVGAVLILRILAARQR